MTKKLRSLKKKRAQPPRPKLPSGYETVLTDLAKLIAESRHRALATVNRELVLLYWQIGAVIVQQQERAEWGDGVVEQLAADLRFEFPDMKGLSRDNVFRMRQFFLACRGLDEWLAETMTQPVDVQQDVNGAEKVGTACPQIVEIADDAIVATLCRHFKCAETGKLLLGLSWSHHRTIFAQVHDPAEFYFYLNMAARERWSVRELRRQIDSALFTRYISVRDEPEKCLPNDAESGDLLPFKDHYVLEFLGLEQEHSERQLRHAILANLRGFFLEFGRDLTFVGEEYPLTVGNDTFSVDLLFFHRQLQCLIAVDLKIGKFKPEYVGKSQFYCAALDEQIRLPHEKPSIGLVLCRSADRVQVRLALTAAAEKIGVATYQTALPDEHLMKQRLRQISFQREDDR